MPYSGHSFREVGVLPFCRGIIIVFYNTGWLGRVCLWAAEAKSFLSASKNVLRHIFTIDFISIPRWHPCGRLAPQFYPLVIITSTLGRMVLYNLATMISLQLRCLVHLDKYLNLYVLISLKTLQDMYQGWGNSKLLRFPQIFIPLILSPYHNPIKIRKSGSGCIHCLSLISWTYCKSIVSVRFSWSSFNLDYFVYLLLEPPDLTFCPIYSRVRRKFSYILFYFILFCGASFTWLT